MQCWLFLTAIWTFLTFRNGVQLSKVLATRPPGYLDFDNLPETNFTCEGKVIGGYYADIETGCQMFHVCTIGQKGDMTDIKFLCLNGTVFDQETRVCERVDEVDCSKSKDFYDLNLELYNNGFVLSEEEGAAPDSKSEEIPDSEEMYDESYDIETEGPSVTTKGIRTSTTTTATTTTTKATAATATTTSRPIVFGAIEPTFGVPISVSHVMTNIPAGHRHGYGGEGTGAAPLRPDGYGGPLGNGQPQSQSGNENVGVRPTVSLLNEKSRPPRPFGYPTTQGHERPPIGKAPTQGGVERLPLSPSVATPDYRPLATTGTFKSPAYDRPKNHLFPPSAPGPITSVLIGGYGANGRGPVEASSAERGKRPVVVVGHRFPTAAPGKGQREEFEGGIGTATLQQQGHPRTNVPMQLHRQSLKSNPTILALQSQQQKVHRLHQEGLEIAEHQIAQVASRNAEISNLRSQKTEDKKDRKETQSIHGEGKEPLSDGRSSFSRPAIAIVASTSSTSSRVRNKPVVTAFIETGSLEGGKQVLHRREPEYRTNLEKLFATAEQRRGDGAVRGAQEMHEEADAVDEVASEDGSDMDLEQLLLAWKLKTNQEVTKEDIERVFSSLDTSKFKNGETIGLGDIFRMRNEAGDSEETTRVAPTRYDDYTEEDVPYDPFYEDVPKVGGGVPERGHQSAESNESRSAIQRGYGNR